MANKTHLPCSNAATPGIVYMDWLPAKDLGMRMRKEGSEHTTSWPDVRNTGPAAGRYITASQAICQVSLVSQCRIEKSCFGMLWHAVQCHSSAVVLCCHTQVVLPAVAVVLLAVFFTDAATIIRAVIPPASAAAVAHERLVGLVMLIVLAAVLMLLMMAVVRGLLRRLL